MSYNSNSLCFYAIYLIIFVCFSYSLLDFQMLHAIIVLFCSLANIYKFTYVCLHAPLLHNYCNTIGLHTFVNFTLGLV